MRLDNNKLEKFELKNHIFNRINDLVNEMTNTQDPVRAKEILLQLEEVKKVQSICDKRNRY